MNSLLYRILYPFQYIRVARTIPDKAKQRARIFNELIENSTDKKCLQIGVREKKHAPHWVSVDKYDESPLIDFHYDVHDLKFDDQSFDMAVCNAVLEHVEYPLKAISELYRILKPNGLVWVEVPFNQYYHPSPNDYWRVTPEGIKIWMKDFKEIESGFFKCDKSSFFTGIFFYGAKPT